MLTYARCLSDSVSPFQHCVEAQANLVQQPMSNQGSGVGKMRETLPHLRDWANGIHIERDCLLHHSLQGEMLAQHLSSFTTKPSAQFRIV